MSEERYKNRRYVGSGSMATVYQAWDTRMEREVALKEVAEELRGNVDVRDMFLNEARKMAKVEDRQVVRVYDVLLENGVPTLVQEFMGGGSLAAHIGASRMGVPELLNLLMRILYGLKAIHKAKLIHRDMKPDNILRNDKGEWKVADFGVAMRGDEETLPFAPNKYAAPEVLNAPETISVRSDLYSVGIMAIELLLGSQTFEEEARNAVEEIYGDSRGGKDSSSTFWQRWVSSQAVLPPINEIEPSISVEVAQLLAQLTARDPENRPSDCDIVLDQIREIQEIEKNRMGAPTAQDGKVKAKKPKSAEEAPEKKKKPLWVKLLFATLAIVTVGIGGLIVAGRMAGGGTPVVLKLTPADANVRLNEVEVASPVSGEDFVLYLQRGSVITIEREGYLPFSAQASRELPEMSVEDSGRMVLTVALEPAALGVTVRSTPSGADLTRSGDELTGKTPLQVDLVPGQEFRLEHPGYEPLVATFSEDMPGITIGESGELVYEAVMTRSFYLGSSGMAIRWLRDETADAPDLKVQLANGSPGKVTVGAPVSYRVSPTSSGYLTVLHLSSDNFLTLIHPNQDNEDLAVRKNREQLVGEDLNLVASEPLGEDWFVFLLTKKPFKVPELEGAKNLEQWARYYEFGEFNSPAEQLLVRLLNASSSTLIARAIVPLEIVAAGD